MRGIIRLFFTAIVVTLLFGQKAHADDTIRFKAVYFEALPQAVSRMAGTLNSDVQACLKDHVCNEGAVLQEIGNNQRLLLYKSFSMKETLHEAPATVQTAIANETVAPPDERQLALLWESPRKPIPAQALWVVTHVDVMPNYKDQAVAMLKDLGEASSAMDGHIRTIVGPQLNRSNHFTLIEVWADRSAFDAYQAAKPTREFRTKLNPMLGALYDARFYRSVH